MTATAQPESKSPSRRALLAGALGGIGAWAASAIGRASPVKAANGDALILGQVNTATATTWIGDTTAGDYAFYVVAEGSGTGVYGSSYTGHGIHGDSYSGHGIHGSSTTGWAGYFDGRVLTRKYHELVEMSTPSAPPSNHARLFIRDNGNGKTQLCVRFHTGAVKVLATQP
jgi:hypothetical protein